MAVVLDTTTLPVAERADAFEAALTSAVFPSYVHLDNGGREPNARVEGWSLGPGVNVVRTMSTGQRLIRTASHVRTAASEQLCVGMAYQGRLIGHQAGRSFGALGSITPTDGLAPYRYDFYPAADAPSLAMCAVVDHDRLGLPVDVMRAALPRLASSPLYALFQAHLAGLPAAAAGVEDTPAAALLGSATSELARALVGSAVGDDQLARESLSEVLLTRLDIYIRNRASDPALNAEQIAAAHNISARYLYRLFSKRSVSLEQQIIHERLEQARAELGHPGASRRSIEAIARRAGFTHPQHFSRRFREAYGVTPREWREDQRRRYQRHAPP
jgi:AraC-like DNA-binding protein